NQMTADPAITTPVTQEAPVPVAAPTPAPVAPLTSAATPETPPSSGVTSAAEGPNLEQVAEAITEATTPPAGQVPPAGGPPPGTGDPMAPRQRDILTSKEALADKAEMESKQFLKRGESLESMQA